MFDENSDLNTTYLGRIDMTRASKFKAEEKFPISEQGYMVGKLLDGMEYHAFKYRSKQIIYVQVTLFEMLIFTFVTKFTSKTQRIQVGNGQYVSVLFVIPEVIDIYGP